VLLKATIYGHHDVIVILLEEDANIHDKDMVRYLLETLIVYSHINNIIMCE
jgi:hypothetical protein